MKNKHIWITLFLFGMNVLLVGVPFARGQDDQENPTFAIDLSAGNSWSDHSVERQITNFSGNMYRYIAAEDDRGGWGYLGFGVYSKVRFDMPTNVDSVYRHYDIPVVVGKTGAVLNEHSGGYFAGTGINLDLGWPLDGHNKGVFYLGVTGKVNFQVTGIGDSRYGLGVFVEAGGVKFFYKDDNGADQSQKMLIAKVGISMNIIPD